MIAKAVKGKGFRGALEYDLTKEKGHLLDTNMAGKNPRQLAEEFGQIRKLKPNLGKAVLHVSLSAAPGERLADDQWLEIGRKYLTGMGLDNNQFVMTRHMDTAHEHIHLVVNRIQFDGKVTSDSLDYKRQDALMRQIEKHFGLVEIAPAYGLDGKKTSGRKAPGKDEIEAGLRTGQLSIRLQLQQLCDRAAQDCNSVTQYRDRLAVVGVVIVPAFQLAGAKLNGLTYQLDGVVMKGGDLGKAYSPLGLSKLGVTYDKNRDFENLSRGAERQQAEITEGLAELGRAVNSTTAASIRRPGELKETNLRADRALEQSSHATGAADRALDRAGAQVGRAELKRAAQGLGAALQALAARRQAQALSEAVAQAAHLAAQELVRRAAAQQALVAQLQLEKEIENDRIRNERLGRIGKNLSSAERHLDGAAGAVRTASGDLGRAVQGAERRQHHRYVRNLAQALGGGLGRLVGALAAVIGQISRYLVQRHTAPVVKVAAQGAPLVLATVVGLSPRSSYHPDNIARRDAEGMTSVAAVPSLTRPREIPPLPTRVPVKTVPEETRTAKQIWAAHQDNKAPTVPQRKPSTVAPIAPVLVPEQPPQQPSAAEVLAEWIKALARKQEKEPTELVENASYQGMVIDRTDGAWAQKTNRDGSWVIHRSPHPPERGRYVEVQVKGQKSVISLVKSPNEQGGDGGLGG